MLFRKDMERENGVWVDRGIDGRVDAFSICGSCREDLHANDPEGQDWHEGQELCPSCRTDFQAHALAVDLLGLSRPFNGMLEDRVLTNDEVDAEPARAVPGAIEYFSPPEESLPKHGAGDPRLFGEGDALSPDSVGPLQVGMEDPFRLDPNYRPFPGLANPLLPQPNDYFLPGMEGYFLPE